MKDKLHDILVELGLSASVDGIDKQMYLKAKNQLLALFSEVVTEAVITADATYTNEHDRKLANHYKAQILESLKINGFTNLGDHS